MIDVRRGGERFETTTDWLTSRHSFSFGQHYDPDNVGHAVLVAHNDDVVAPGHGYDLHPHADLEIVTWVLAGSLVHEDSHGHSGVRRPGRAAAQRRQRRAAQRAQRRPRRRRADPVRADVGAPRRVRAAPVLRAVAGRRTGLTALASGIPGLDAAVRIHTAGAALHVARLVWGSRWCCRTRRGCTSSWPAGRSTWRAPAGCREGDAARFTAEGGPGSPRPVAAEVLVWQLP